MLFFIARPVTAGVVASLVFATPKPSSFTQSSYVMTSAAATLKIAKRILMAITVIFLVSAICGVCGAGIAIGIAMVVWPESKTTTKV